MDREQASELVAPITVAVGGFQGVSAFDARQLLGDPVRKLGPRKGFVYPWNVVDYLWKGALPRNHDLPNKSRGCPKRKPGDRLPTGRAKRQFRKARYWEWNPGQSSSGWTLRAFAILMIVRR